MNPEIVGGDLSTVAIVAGVVLLVALVGVVAYAVYEGWEAISSWWSNLGTTLGWGGGANSLAHSGIDSLFGPPAPESQGIPTPAVTQPDGTLTQPTTGFSLQPSNANPQGSSDLDFFENMWNGAFSPGGTPATGAQLTVPDGGVSPSDGGGS
jgi:hypothetical protein